jgi:hypothetical protein
MHKGFALNGQSRRSNWELEHRRGPAFKLLSDPRPRGQSVRGA